MTLTGQPQITYGYDNADRMTSITQGAASVGSTYDDAGRPLTSTLPNGVVGTYTYDDDSHVKAITYTTGSTTVGDLSYTYDASGHRTTAGGSLARVSLPTAVSTTTYNADNQLTKWASAATQPTYDLPDAGSQTPRCGSTRNRDNQGLVLALRATGIAPRVTAELPSSLIWTPPTRRTRPAASAERQPSWNIAARDRDGRRGLRRSWAPDRRLADVESTQRLIARGRMAHVNLSGG